MFPVPTICGPWVAPASQLSCFLQGGLCLGSHWFPSLCMSPCPQLWDYSVLNKLSSHRCPWWWWDRISVLACSLYLHHPIKYWPIPDNSQEPSGPVHTIPHWREYRENSGEAEGLQGLHEFCAQLMQLHLGQHTWGWGATDAVSHMESPSSHRPESDIWDTHPGCLSQGRGRDPGVSSYSRAQFCLPQDLSPLSGESWGPHSPGQGLPLMWKWNLHVGTPFSFMWGGMEVWHPGLYGMSVGTPPLLNSLTMCIPDRGHLFYETHWN